MLSSLMSARRFAPLFWCQFFSAFNDNFIKQALTILAVYGIAETAPMAGGDSFVSIAGAFLVLPGLFLSGLAGQLADRFDKARVARAIKLAEIAIVAIAAFGFAVHSAPILLASMLTLGIMGTLFTPVKYGMLPDQLAPDELPAGNGLIEAGTFLSILIGIIGAGFVAPHLDSIVVAGIMVAVALACWLFSRGIPPTGEAAPTLKIDWNVIRSSWGLVGLLARDRRLMTGSIAVAWFWMSGIVMLSLTPSLAHSVIGGDETVNTLFTTSFSIGIAVGSVLAARLSAGRTIVLLTPIGCILMGLVGLDVAWIALGTTASATPLPFVDYLHTGSGVHMTLALGVMAVGAGLFVVPIYAAVQAWSPKDERARVIAGGNVLSALFMSVGAGGLALLQSRFGLTSPMALLGLAVLDVAAGLVFLAILPMSLVRDVTLLIYRLLFRVEVRGIENLETDTPRRIIAINHVSFLDAPLILALLDKDPVFAIDHTIARAWWVKPFLKLCRAFPLDPTKPLATRSLINAVKAGDTLVIFPEGRLTVTGSLMKVYDGAGLIADKSQAEIVPVRIDGLERTYFTRLGPGKVSRRWFPKVVVTFTEPQRLAIDETLRGRKRRQAAGAALYDVMSDLIYKTSSTDQTLFQALAAASRKFRPSRVILEDPVTGPLTYKRLLIAIEVLGRKFRGFTGPGEHVGVLLPNANAVAVTFFGLQAIGRVPAMLNFSAGKANLISACTTAEIRTVLSSRAFVEKGRLEEVVAALEAHVKFVWLEDLRKGVTAADKLAGYFGAGRQHGRISPDASAAVLFTSGSEGTPKGVVLSHRNILSNIAQIGARIDFGPGDIVFNVLPVFHSFGLTGGLILPLVNGVKVYLYPSPLHYRIIPELVYSANATALFGTDTFLAGYAKMANPYDFRSLRYVVAGAEPVKVETRRAYNEKFGLRILEGYGVTETSPVLALNTPMFNRNGTVGRVLPGMETRLDPVPGIEEGGRLHVRGPNVMQGYLKADQPGRIMRPEGGWHDTGDIVAIDSQGFVAIKGRAKRFAKIGGEMVSLAAVEGLLADLWPETPVAVLAAPDPRKGERLVLVTTTKQANRSDVVAHLKQKHAADLMMPSEIIVLDTMPLMGTGKTDYVALERLMRERQASAAAPQAAAGTPDTERASPEPAAPPAVTQPDSAQPSRSDA
ncbi:acyl-[ACP]--phospholipid O-acyltransferase [Labrys monachus]|uniref:Acyl-[acyl-carrier-protein]-phospholipid O-acyltransferase/long-chain-fatty-acid--[acyl-carrier-protein] ligase n=1 Tax=Labrys monachus TaxID=217067 RepID=A0ABU0FJJ2_9HYPH|nr:acyl-[ACP]--phospholipid O-acyltransferase [Labrys monachus]MDQ0394517.1 acyl-[acyl-carrier-protein]-phospholipid O-acyltransferase/long-chain-fatty-acid--[acyl-carrier-protein] ligase [Labrys monachus]